MWGKHEGHKDNTGLRVFFVAFVTLCWVCGLDQAGDFMSSGWQTGFWKLMLRLTGVKPTRS